MNRLRAIGIIILTGLVLGPTTLVAQPDNDQAARDKKELLQGYHQKPGVSTPMVLPTLTVRDSEGNDVSLNDLFGESEYTVVKILRGEWSIRCTNALGELGRSQDRLSELGAQLVAITPERVEHAQRQVDQAIGTDDLSIEYYIDTTTEVIRALHVAERLRERVVEQFVKSLDQRRGYVGRETHPNASGEWITPVTATAIVDRTGTLVWMQASWDARQQATPDEIIEAIESLGE
ncbi:MAG: redoxin domain-containing protein [Planctomycetota bacterium]|jgi:peroxiredoxin